MVRLCVGRRRPGLARVQAQPGELAFCAPDSNESVGLAPNVARAQDTVMRSQVVFSHSNRGLGLLEIVGCLVAMAIGIWIGAQYLGVDLNGAAYQALDETELLTSLPEEWRPENPECPDGDCASADEKRSAAAAELSQERDRLRLEVARLRGDESGATASSEILLDEATQFTRAQTTAYWQQLHDVVVELEQIRSQTESLLGGEEHSRVLSVRRQAYDYSARAIENIAAEGVDEQAVEAAARVAEWCRKGAETFAAAAELAGRKPVGGRSVRAEQLWSQARTELEKRTDMVRRKAAETQVYLNGKYFVELSDLPL